MYSLPYYYNFIVVLYIAGARDFEPCHCVLLVTSQPFNSHLFQTPFLLACHFASPQCNVLTCPGTFSLALTHSRSLLFLPSRGESALTRLLPSLSFCLCLISSVRNQIKFPPRGLEMCAGDRLLGNVRISSTRPSLPLSMFSFPVSCSHSLSPLPHSASPQPSCNK